MCRRREKKVDFPIDKNVIWLVKIYWASYNPQPKFRTSADIFLPADALRICRGTVAVSHPIAYPSKVMVAFF